MDEGRFSQVAECIKRQRLCESATTNAIDTCLSATDDALARLEGGEAGADVLKAVAERVQAANVVKGVLKATRDYHESIKLLGKVRSSAPERTSLVLPGAQWQRRHIVVTGMSQLGPYLRHEARSRTCTCCRRSMRRRRSTQKCPSGRRGCRGKRCSRCSLVMRMLPERLCSRASFAGAGGRAAAWCADSGAHCSAPARAVQPEPRLRVRR